MILLLCYEYSQMDVMKKILEGSLVLMIQIFFVIKIEFIQVNVYISLNSSYSANQ